MKTVAAEDSRCWHIRQGSAKDCDRCGNPSANDEGFFLFNTYHCAWWCLTCGERYLRIAAPTVPHVYPSAFKADPPARTRAEEIATALRAKVRDRASA